MHPIIGQAIGRVRAAAAREPQAFHHRAPRTKMCRHFEEVADVAQQVASGELAPPSGEAVKVLCEEYLMLHLEFQALMTHLEQR